jgi:Fe2+ or Zn2+ uptake regulation protein
MDVDALVDALRAEGLRLTPARRAICQVLADDPRAHLTPGDLHERAEVEAGRPIDLSTVYRTLDTLQEVGLVHHVHVPDGGSVVHLADADHHHLTCDRCGRTVDVPAEEIAAALGPLAERHGFSVDTVHFAVVGRCHDCARLPPEEPYRSGS